MAKQLSEDQLRALETLFKASSPGQWKVRKMPEGMMGSHPGFIQAPRAKSTDPYDIELLGEDDTLYPTRDGDMAFIVAMQNAFESLILTARKGATK